MKNEFINSIKEGAIQGWEEHQILPSLTMAQAILESGWGTSRLAKEANNLFGIKASKDWTGEKHLISSKEFKNGKYIDEISFFRKYESLNDSVKDHGAFFHSTESRKNRYSKVIGQDDYKIVAYEIGQSGYATDSDYGNKILKIIEENKLFEFDPKGAEKEMANSHLVIAGHGRKRNGQWDSGAVYNGVTEAGLLRSDVIPEMKKFDGGKIDYITDYNVYDYGNMADFKKYKTVTELHFNAFGDPSANGTEVLIYSGYNPDEMDQELLNKMSKYFNNRGIKKRSDLQNVNLSAHHGINYRLLEICFISNKGDLEKFIKNKTEIAKDLVSSILGEVKQVEEKKKEEVVVPDWQSEAVEQVIEKLNLDGNYWRNRKDKPVTVGEIFAIINKL